MKAPNRWMIASYVSAGVFLSLLATGIPTKHWHTYTLSGNDFHEGLWHICIDGGVCSRLDIDALKVTSTHFVAYSLLATRYLVLISAGLSGVGLLTGLAHMLENDKFIAWTISLVFYALGMVVGVVGCFLYPFTYKAEVEDIAAIDTSLGWSYILFATGMSGMLVTTVLHSLGKSDKDAYTQMQQLTTRQ